MVRLVASFEGSIRHSMTEEWMSVGIYKIFFPENCFKEKKKFSEVEKKEAMWEESDIEKRVSNVRGNRHGERTKQCERKEI